MLWTVATATRKRADATNDPLVVKDKVLVGISGGEFGVRGHVSAYDINSGKRVWRAYSMGPDADTLLDPEKTTMMGKPVGKDSGKPLGKVISGRSAAGRRGVGTRMIRT